MKCDCGRDVDTEELKKHYSIHICPCGQSYVLNDKTGEFDPYIKFKEKKLETKKD